MSDEKSFHLAIGSRFENIELVQLVLKDTLDQLGLDDDNRHWIDVAVREAVANAIKHGNLQDPAKQVHVDLALEGSEGKEGSEDWLIIRVQDEGIGFDPAELEDPLAPENLLKPNGRGIFYMKSFMDDIQYGVRPGGGTVVTMRKRLTPVTGSSAPNANARRE
ncbi:MAG: ATP-binding protein [Acidobacteria bacterium]|nr:ATP-binding protein [Acidobacteriota bacterium]